MSPEIPPETPPTATSEPAGSAARSASLPSRILRWIRDAALLVAGLAMLLALGLGGFFYWLAQHRFDEAGMPSGQEVSFPLGVRPAVLFFGAASGDSLVPVFRFVPEAASTPERAVRLVAELAAGPDDADQLRLLPAGAVVRHAFLDEDGQLYLDFEPGLARGFVGGSTAEYLCLASLVRTLAANLPQVKSVTVSVAGSPIPSLAGHFPLQEELEVSQWW